ncbi:hypothetical protein WMF31_31445 [Sorangium sp. So ce1036]|uniref:hypothetical protein n=1 Tax=Sorangium sp. So ce1036 TaxID=3133328 RepID=UPI003EFD640F
MFEELRARLASTFRGTGSFSPDSVEDLAKCRKIVRELLDSDRFGYLIDLTSPSSPAPARIHFVPAGHFDEAHAERARCFDWQGFYQEFSEVFGLLRAEWRRRYDYVMLDARTGLTDIGSITTVVLPSRLVVVFSPNNQSLSGAVEVSRQAFEMHRRIAPEPLAILPLLARVEPGEKALRGEWVQRAAGAFSKLFLELYGNEGCDWVRYFESLHVPHGTYYSYDERIAVVEQLERGLGSLTEAYEGFLECVQCASVAEWESRTRSKAHVVDVDRAVLMQFDAPFEAPAWLSVERVIRIPDPQVRAGVTAVELRQVPVSRAAWSRAVREIELGIERDRAGLRGAPHVFVMSPYAAAVLLGRKLDQLARAVPLYLYQFDTAAGDWMLFSAPAAHVSIPAIEPFSEAGPDHA